MMFMVGSIKVSVEVKKIQVHPCETRAEQVYRDVLTRKHFDQVRAAAMRNATLAGLR
ncbi:MAG: hypothetical protein ACM3ZO_10705 [Clostridia bacterium]